MSKSAVFRETIRLKFCLNSSLFLTTVSKFTETANNGRQTGNDRTDQSAQGKLTIEFFYNSWFPAKSWQNPTSIDIQWVATNCRKTRLYFVTYGDNTNWSSFSEHSSEPYLVNVFWFLFPKVPVYNISDLEERVTELEDSVADLELGLTAVGGRSGRVGNGNLQLGGKSKYPGWTISVNWVRNQWTEWQCWK